MQNVFYEEDGKFKVAQVMSENDTHLQVENISGKRFKLKSNQILMTFDSDVSSFLDQALEISQTIEVHFLWEICPQNEFEPNSLARDYFGEKCGLTEVAALMIVLYSNPTYFYRKSKGKFKAAEEKTLKSVLQAKERKEKEQSQINSLVLELNQGKIPEGIDCATLISGLEKESILSKAINQAAKSSNQSLVQYLLNIGAIDDLPKALLDAFIVQNNVLPCPEELEPDIGNDFIGELAEEMSKIRNEQATTNSFVLYKEGKTDLLTRAFSIDDRFTTEIDDAFSIVDLPNGNHKIGIHIATPTLGIDNESEFENYILSRYSTIYLPNIKLEMLPPKFIDRFSLNEGNYVSALSLYVEINDTFDIISCTTVIDIIYITDNLRIEDLEQDFNNFNLNSKASFDCPYKKELTHLWNFAKSLESKRSKEDTPRSPNHIIKVIEDEITITTRPRGEAIETTISELMILTNSTWGKMLADSNVLGIYRNQAYGYKVAMSCEAGSHHLLNIDKYAWTTSPLRRAVDYINQKQLISILLSGHKKPLFTEENRLKLSAFIQSFESRYHLYSQFQSKMERYFSLLYIKQQHWNTLIASVIKDDLLQIEGLPLTIKLTSLPSSLKPGDYVKLRIRSVNLAEQILDARFLELYEGDQSKNCVQSHSSSFP